MKGASPTQSANSQCRHERSTPMSTVSKLGTWRRERERASSAADSARSFDRADSAEGCEQGRGEGVGEGEGARLVGRGQVTLPCHQSRGLRVIEGRGGEEEANSGEKRWWGCPPSGRRAVSR